MALTLAGGLAGALGAIMTGQTKGAEATSKATEASEMAAAMKQAGDITEYSGFRAAETTGMQTRAAIGKQAVEYAAGNIGGKTTTQVKDSQIALGVQSSKEIYNKYAETALQERWKGAQETVAANRYTLAAAADRREGTLGAITASINALSGAATDYAKASQVGEASPVSSKWYMMALGD